MDHAASCLRLLDLFIISSDNSTTTAPSSQPAPPTPTSTSSQSTPTSTNSSGATTAKAHGANYRTIIIASVIPSVVALIALIVFFLWRRRNDRRMLREKSEPFTTQRVLRTSGITRMAHGDHVPQGLAFANSNSMLLPHGQQHFTDDTSNLVYSSLDTPAEELSVPVRSKTTRTARTSPPEYHALFPTE